MRYGNDGGNGVFIDDDRAFNKATLSVRDCRLCLMLFVVLAHYLPRQSTLPVGTVLSGSTRTAVERNVWKRDKWREHLT